MPFQNRTDAGRKLAAALRCYKDQGPVILALPRGGVPVAAEIAAALRAPLDLVLVRVERLKDIPLRGRSEFRARPKRLMRHSKSLDNESRKPCAQPNRSFRFREANRTQQQ